MLFRSLRGWGGGACFFIPNMPMGSRLLDLVGVTLGLATRLSSRFLLCHAWIGPITGRLPSGSGKIRSRCAGSGFLPSLRSIRPYGPSSRFLFTVFLALLRNMHSFPAVPLLRGEKFPEISPFLKLFFTKRPNYDMLCQYVPERGAPTCLVLGQRRVLRGASARPSLSGREINRKGGTSHDPQGPKDLCHRGQPHP